MSDAEREFEAAKLKPKTKPTANAQGKAKAKRTSPPKKGESTAMNRDARAAIAHSRKPKPTPNAAAVTAAGAGATGALAPSAGAEDLTISFWVYLLADVVGKFRTLIYRVTQPPPTSAPLPPSPLCFGCLVGLSFVVRLPCPNRRETKTAPLPTSRCGLRFVAFTCAPGNGCAGAGAGARRCGAASECVVWVVWVVWVVGCVAVG
jgi:hypothetical protein